MLKKDKFKELMKEVERIKRVAEGDETIYWEVYDNSQSLLGYSFYIEIPETPPEVEEVEEFDKYEVWGIISLDYKIMALDICPHPAGPEKLWAQEIVEPDYRAQYLGLMTDQINLSPNGKIDAVSDATISSKLITEAIKIKIEEIMKKARG